MKNLVVVALLVLCLGFGSAHDIYYKVLYGHNSGEPERFSESKYFVEDRIVLSRVISVDYDTLSGHKNLIAGNDDRHSTYDYRHGYSYRATRDYFERKYDDVFSYNDRFEKMDFNMGYGFDYHKNLGSDVKGSYYEYVPHLGSYEKRECYLSAPSDRLFYVKCP